MKRIFTLSLLLIGLTVLLGSCTKRGFYDDEEYWLRQERGVVVYSSDYCNYFVVETFDGYTILRASGGFLPFEGDVVYGDLSYYGYGTFYNFTAGRTFQGTVTDYWLNYFTAQDKIDYYCY